MAVSDFADGLDAVDVSIRLPEGAPARLNYWSRDEDRHWVGKNVPITVADGESEHLKVEIIASPGQDAFQVAPLIKAGNASVDTRLPTVLIGNPVPDRSVEVYSGVTYRPLRRSAEGVDVRGACSSARISSREIDFGDLPIQPRGPRAHERIRFGVQPPIQLLWDSQHEAMIPGDAWEEVDVLLDLLRRVDPVWAEQFDVEVLQQRPPVIRTVAGKYEKELFFRGLRVPPSSVAYFVFDLKLSNSSNPYVHLAWRGREHREFSDQRRFSVVTVPDGTWRTYAIPLHEIASWRDAGMVDEFRFSVGVNGAVAEISRLQLVGPVRYRRE